MSRLPSLLREFRSPGTLAAAAFLGLLIVAAVLAPWVAPYDPLAQSSHRLLSPGGAHLLGTDQFGRDVFSRLVTGARVDLLVSFGAAGLAAFLGVSIGLVGGTSRGLVRMLTMRGIEVILAFPPIVFALLVVTLFGPGALTLVVTMGILFAPSFARIVYGEVLTISNLEYVQASRVIGSSRRRILGRVILPGVLPPVLVQLSLTVATAMLLSSGLSYLGLGVVPPTPSWGGMIAEGQALMMQSPLLLLFSSGVVVATVLCFSVLADALERALDPRRGRGRRPATPAKPLSVS
ncbi:ABC transporter permease [Aeromicrobium phragmitis]|uniref:ABC transporter permease n=1 Tax=Aeromicrobium phragmitis TaxID=2478914 RepID=A0A3L8PIC2_9ACTN|nr:ABC transporter permease [Aeromicrobium phragmitis]RLV55085.1 ABC transporter permease [Aeromicrobium phragmitis]